VTGGLDLVLLLSALTFELSSDKPQPSPARPLPRRSRVEGSGTEETSTTKSSIPKPRPYLGNPESLVSSALTIYGVRKGKGDRHYCINPNCTNSPGDKSGTGYIARIQRVVLNANTSNRSIKSII